MLEKVSLGRTGLMVTRLSMGCIPIQRLSEADAVALLRRAFDGGVNFYDTAYVYSDSEAKMGQAFAGMRDKVIIASKTMSDSYEKAMEHIDESLRRLKTDYIDLYQWHNPEDLDDFQNRRGPYQAMLDAQRAGKIRFIGISQHHLGRAHDIVDSGVFDTLQFPFSVLSSQDEIDLTFKCRDKDIGFIAMKAMCGGMLDDGRLPFAFMHQFPHVVPIWGLERPEELDQFLRLYANPMPFTGEMREEIGKLRAELGDSFCRGCGYCLPCPAGISLPVMMRIVWFIKRNPSGSQFTPERIAEVDNISECVDCRHCVEHCPYHLEAPEILKKQQEGFRQLYREFQAKG